MRGERKVRTHHVIDIQSNVEKRRRDQVSKIRDLFLSEFLYDKSF